MPKTERVCSRWCRSRALGGPVRRPGRRAGGVARSGGATAPACVPRARRLAWQPRARAPHRAGLGACHDTQAESCARAVLRCPAVSARAGLTLFARDGRVRRVQCRWRPWPLRPPWSWWARRCWQAPACLAASLRTRSARAPLRACCPSCGTRWDSARADIGRGAAGPRPSPAHHAHGERGTAQTELLNMWDRPYHTVTTTKLWNAASDDASSDDGLPPPP